MRPEAPAWLPLLNAGLIVVSGLFLAIGYACIRRKKVAWHRRSMLTATTFAALFLVVYITRWVMYPTKTWAGDPNLRVIYALILISHIILAAAIAPMVFIVIRRALRSEFARHRKLARITLPIWAYVVITGWLIYWMLYQLPG